MSIDMFDTMLLASVSVYMWPILGLGRRSAMKPIELRPVLAAIVERYTLSLDGIHGVAHWARVLENGLMLAGETGADVAVVSLFAVLHDSRRLNDGYDPDHGPRAARFAEKLRGTVFDLDDSAFRLLVRACEGHTHDLTHPDVTVQTCYDADRLDLGRVGMVPHRERLCTDSAKRKEVIDRCYGRGAFNVVPDFVSTDWGLGPAYSS